MKGISEVYRRSIAYASSAEKQGQSLLFAIVGLIIGAILSTLIIVSLPVSMQPLEEARKLGIVSRTILDNYPKHQEVINYIVGIVSTIFIAITFWFLWAIVTSRQTSLNHQDLRLDQRYTFQSLDKKENSTFWKFIDYVLLPMVIFLVTFNQNAFFGWIHPWVFFLEEGQYLSAVNSIFQGQILYKDIFFIYGPLMIYPLAGLMKLFGAEVAILRIYTYLLTLLAFFIIYFLLRKLLRNRLFVAIFLFIFILFYFPLFPTPNASVFRVMIGLSPLLFLCSYFDIKKMYLLFTAGAVAGISVFFSQEVGLVAIIAAVSSLIMDAVANRRGMTKLSKDLSIFVVAIIMVAGPILIYFAIQGALNDFVKNVINYPRYVMMGYGGLPFLNLFASVKELFVNPFDYLHIKNFIRLVTIYYWPIFLYAWVGSYLIIHFITSRWDNRDTIISGILIFGGLLFRVALARSVFTKTLWCLPPAIILAGIYIEDIYYKINRFAKIRKSNRVIYEVTLWLIIIFIIGGVAGFAIWPSRPYIKEFINSTLIKISMPQKGSYNARDMVAIGINRAKNVYAPKEWTIRIRDVVNYIKLHTLSTDYIYAFPNECTYYFLTGRLNPSRFNLSSLSITTEHRLEAVKDLEAKKPKYVIYTMDVLQIDGIHESIQVPEISEYINRKYILEKEFEGTKILKRKELKRFQ